MGPTLDALNALDSGQALTFAESAGSNVLALGPSLDSFRCIRFGPGADVDESTGPKVLAVGPTLDSLDSLYAFDALDSEAPEGPGGGNLDLKSWGHCRFIRFIRFGPRP